MKEGREAERNDWDGLLPRAKRLLVATVALHTLLLCPLYFYLPKSAGAVLVEVAVLVSLNIQVLSLVESTRSKWGLRVASVALLALGLELVLNPLAAASRPLALGLIGGGGAATAAAGVRLLPGDSPRQCFLAQTLALALILGGWLLLTPVRDLMGAGPAQAPDHALNALRLLLLLPAGPVVVCYSAALGGWKNHQFVLLAAGVGSYGLCLFDSGRELGRHGLTWLGLSVFAPFILLTTLAYATREPKRDTRDA